MCTIPWTVHWTAADELHSWSNQKQYSTVTLSAYKSNKIYSNCQMYFMVFSTIQQKTDWFPCLAITEHKMTLLWWRAVKHHSNNSTCPCMDNNVEVMGHTVLQLHCACELQCDCYGSLSVRRTCGQESSDCRPGAASSGTCLTVSWRSRGHVADDVLPARSM